MTPTTLFKCLADETRLRCIALLHKEGKLCVCELTYALDLLQPKISRHLSQLRQSKLLIDSREGQWVYYQLNPALPEWAFSILEIAVKQLENQLLPEQDSIRLKTMNGRPDMKSCCG
jgi:ArsR family transcriptional regulator, arsenate/arsenite/antimonite-responsive transcriptional repressor